MPHQPFQRFDSMMLSLGYYHNLVKSKGYVVKGLAISAWQYLILPNDMILYWAKFKEFASNNSNILVAEKLNLFWIGKKTMWLNLFWIEIGVKQ